MPTCHKDVYESRDAALLSIAAMWGRPERVLQRYMRFGKIPVRAYQCSRCGKWHLTSRPLPVEGALA